MFDSCVVSFGTIISNKLQERDEVGDSSNRRYVQRYTLQELLDSDFKLPREGEESSSALPVGIDGLLFDEVK